MTNLLSLFDDVWKSLPQDEDDESDAVSFSPENLPPSPETLHADGLCITKQLHFYNDFPVEAIHLSADKHTLGKLGLLIFSTMFHEDLARIVLELTHPYSTIGRLVISRDWIQPLSLPGLHVAPQKFNYASQAVERYPWPQEMLQPYQLPVMYLTNQEESVNSAHDLQQRNVAVGFGPIEASCRFAELLLNASRPSNTQAEFVMEAEMGVRGVGLASTEIILWLPGGVGFSC